MYKKIIANKKQVATIVLKHLVISATCATVDFVGFGFAVYYLKTSLALAYALAFLLATTIGFFGHTYFTFNVGRLHFKNALLFMLQASLAFLVGYVLLMLFIGMGAPVMLSKFLQLGLVFFFNVSVGKFLTFKRRIVNQ